MPLSAKNIGKLRLNSPFSWCFGLTLFFFVNGKKSALHLPVDSYGHERENGGWHGYSLNHTAYLTHHAAKWPPCRKKEGGKNDTEGRLDG